MNKKLFNRDFLLIVIGQIISLFGNVILRFAISLYILDITGSATAFGTILAISMIPTIILAPFGGMLADRINRRNIMVMLDFTTAVLIVIFIFCLKAFASLPIITIMLLALALIQAFYQPSVQASIPLLQNDNHIIQANAVVNQVNALANLIGPILGGFLYGFFGIWPILIISGGSFFVSAIIEIFIHMPFTPIAVSGSIGKTIVSDFKESMHFVGKEKPTMLKALIFTGSASFFVVGVVTIGMPYLIRITLGLSAELYGVTEAFLGLAGILGGIGAGLLANKIKTRHLYFLLAIPGLLLLPPVLALLMQMPPMVTYICLTIVFAMIQFVFCMFSIFLLSSIQQQTPNNMLGKVMSYVTVITMCAQSLSQAAYGVVFDVFDKSIYVPLLITALLICILGLVSKATFKIMDKESVIEGK